MPDNQKQNAFQRLSFKRIEELNSKTNVVSSADEGLNSLEVLLNAWPLERITSSHSIGHSRSMNSVSYVEINDFCYLIKNSCSVSSKNRTLSTEIVCSTDRTVPEQLLADYKKFYGSNPVSK